VQAPAWPATPPVYSGSKAPLPLPTGATDEPSEGAAQGGAHSPTAAAAKRCLLAVCAALEEAEGELNALDGKVG
jgi:hypothetical protein